jgi:hypothetical protein
MKRQSFRASSGIAVWCGVLLVFLACCLDGMAQGSTSSVTGTVVDPAGNVIPGASVTLTNAQKNFTRTQTTTDNGSFAFSLIPPGQYQVEAEAKGFKKGILTDVSAQVAKPTTLTVQLEIGSVSESVTVSAGAGEVLVNKQDGTLGNNFINRQITQLPLEARSPLALVTLQPAVTKEGYVAGARSDQSNVTLDGIDINDAQTNAIADINAIPSGGTGQLIAPQSHPVIRLNAEAIEEFRVTTVNANASAGRSSGAQIALVSKSGSNEWHGALFLANRNTSTTANDFYNNRSGLPRPKLIRNTYGGALGGPIIKDKFFFFYSYEGRQDVSETQVERTVPLASLGRGEVRYVNPSGGITTLNTAQLNTIFPAQINPLAVAALADAAAKYPANDFNFGDSLPGRPLNTAGFIFNAPTPVKLNSHSGRFDYNLNDKQILFLRANIIYDLTGGIPQFPDTPSPDLWEHPWGFVAGHTWTINSRWVNNFRYGVTREAFSQQGDSGENQITFRFVFAPRRFLRTLNRVTPVQNFTDDISWTRDSHSFQFGGNVRLISNQRSSFSNAYDNAITNPSFYIGGGNSISGLVNNFSPIGPGFASAVQNAATAVIGRLSQYSALFTFNQDGTILPSGSSADRDFRTREYDVYGQDVWKISPNLTLTYGLRYSLSTPLWENNGFETTTSIPLTTYFERRLAGAAAGKPYNELISIQLSGKKNGKPPLYDWDKNNFQPRVAIAWSPKFSGGFFGNLFGTNSQSVFRGGFGITNDYYGQQLAVSFDLNNALGFSSSRNINANTYSVTGVTRPLAPLFTGFGQAVRPLPGITIPGNLTFPQTAPMTFTRPIQSSLDSALVAPINYSWNFTYERELPKGMVLQLSYIGRSARKLIASRDVMALNNLVDPKSGMDWYTAAGILEDLRRAGVPASQVPQIPYFANLFPSNLATLMNDNYWGANLIDPTFNQTQAVYANADAELYGNDWTDIQDVIDQAINGGISTQNNLFFQPQYGALSSFSSIARSNYNAGTISLRERLGTSLTMDFNYTLSHSLDDASGLATSAAFGGAFILNPILQHNSYANSDFDIRHIINANAVWQLPVGRGRRFLHDSNGIVDSIIGGWQLSGIFRWNSGLPVGFYGDSGVFDDTRWATNWNAQSNVTRIRPIKTCPTRGTATTPAKLFGCNTLEAYQSFRNAKPGETGDRNVFRAPGYVVLDMGLGKSFTMPWSERHKLQIRVEAFNLTNTQRLGQYDTSRTGFGVVLDPQNAVPPSNWSNFIAPIQGAPRVMQFGFRYEF